MNTARLKNTVIAILVLLNICLLALLVSRKLQERTGREHTLAQLVTLFSKNGISLSPDCVPDNVPIPSVVDPARELEREESFAAALLGPCVREDVGGGIYRYVGKNGQCLLRLSGAVEASPGLSVNDPDAYCTELFRRYGYDRLTSDLSGGSGTVTAVRRLSTETVFNARLTLTFLDGTLISADGFFLPDIAAAKHGEGVDAVTALTRFLDCCIADGELCRAVTGMSCGYLLQNTASEPQRLVPAWRIETDGKEHYVNILTGEVTHEA